MNLLYEEVPCNLCGSTSYQVLYAGKIKDDPAMSLEDLKENYSASSNMVTSNCIVKCDQYRLIFINPRPKME